MNNRVQKNDPSRYKASLFGEEISTYNQGKTRAVTGADSAGGSPENKMLVTVIIKQAGFYGSQQQFEVAVNANSHLLRALDKERPNGQEATKLILDQVAKACQSVIVSLVS